jgi:excisionase family DNA binding protein
MKLKRKRFAKIEGVTMEYMTPSEAGKILKVSAQRVRQLEETGKLPAAMKVANGMRLFSRESVERLAEQRRQNVRTD